MPGSAQARCPKTSECDGDGCYHHGKHRRRPDCKIVSDPDCVKCKPVSMRAVHRYVEVNDDE